MRKTHCKRGHAFDYSNTYVRGNGFRQCRKCANEHKKKRREEMEGLRKSRGLDKEALGIDRKAISATCAELDRILPGRGNLVDRAHLLINETKLRSRK